MRTNQPQPASRSIPAIGLSFSLMLHIGLVLFLLFDLNLKGCLYQALPESLVAALLTAEEEPQAAAPEVVTVDLYGEVPWLTEAAEQTPPADEAEAAGETAEPPAVDPEAIALGPQAPPQPEPELKKRTEPPKVEAPKIETEATTPAPPKPRADKRPQPPPKNKVMPLHEIITRSLGPDAANRMVGRSGGTVKDPEIQRYAQRVLKKFKSNTEPFATRRPQRMATHFSIIVQPDGKISAFRINRSSGDAAFDRAAHQAVMKSSPLPALPSSFGGRPWQGNFTFYSDDF